MRWASSSIHARHDPEVELEASRLQPPFEHPGRVSAIEAALHGRDGFDAVEVDTIAPDRLEDAIAAVHDPGLVAFLATAWERYQLEVGPRREVVPDVFAVEDLRRGMGPGREPVTVAGALGYWAFETTTPLVEGSHAAALGAVEVALTATRWVLEGDAVTFGACRPPGHHATRSRYGGYCFFNNAAIAAQWALDQGAQRVSVLDVDYHHGNGTQQIFYDRAEVQYVSLHADPIRAFPYHVGHADEIGTGAGRASTWNRPLPAGVDDDTYLGHLAEALDVVDAHRPDLVVVSLGLDTLDTDPLGDFALSLDGLRRCGDAVGARGHATVVLLEGGYHVERLGAAGVAWLEGCRDAR